MIKETDAWRAYRRGDELAKLYKVAYEADADGYKAAQESYKTENDKIAALKVAADDLGMKDDKVLSGGKTLPALKVLYEEATAARVKQKGVYDEQVVEKDRQVAINKQAVTWAAEALARYDRSVIIRDGGKLDGVDILGYVKDLDVATKAQTKASSEHKASLETYENSLKADTATDVKKTGPLAAGAEYKAVVEYRGTADKAKIELEKAVKACEDKRADVVKAVLAKKELEKTHATELAKCETAKYKVFRDNYLAARKKRVDDLKKIGDAIKAEQDKRKKLKPGSGTVGARCERPRSNGDRRTRVPCGADLCCGAASKLMGSVLVTIETCQKTDATKYKYTPPRAPMASTAGKEVEWDFACIGGASRVLAAVAAAAGVGLMMQ